MSSFGPPFPFLEGSMTAFFFMPDSSLGINHSSHAEPLASKSCCYTGLAVDHLYLVVVVVVVVNVGIFHQKKVKLVSSIKSETKHVINNKKQLAASFIICNVKFCCRHDATLHGGHRIQCILSMPMKCKGTSSSYAFLYF